MTQQKCDQETERIAGGAVSAAPVQGGTSYTVVANNDNRSFVVQFRVASSALDLKLVECVELAYAGFAPQHQLVGSTGNLLVYQMNNVGGTAMYLAREQLYRNNFSLLRVTVQDYARFFASAWHNTPNWMPSPSRGELFADYSAQLRELHRGLPNRFGPMLVSILAGLPTIFADDWPLVPNHTDLLENNIHVDRATGHLVGICDWKDATVGPFGASLGGLETMLGINRTRDWCYHPNQQELRELFWQAFYEATGDFTPEQAERMEVARMAGLFLAHGFEADEGGNRFPARDGEGELPYLESVTLKLKSLQPQAARHCSSLARR